MNQYRKKPVVIEAYQMLTQQDAADGVCTGGFACKGHGPDGSWPHIHTLEGDHSWTAGDWVIRGVKGEYYFCKPDIFALTYEASAPAGEEPAPHAWEVEREGPEFEMVYDKPDADDRGNKIVAIRPLYLHSRSLEKSHD